MPKVKISTEKLTVLASKYHISDIELAAMLGSNEKSSPTKEAPATDTESRPDPLFIRNIYTLITTKQQTLSSSKLVDNIVGTDNVDRDALFANGHWIPDGANAFDFLLEISPKMTGNNYDSISAYRTIRSTEYENELKECLCKFEAVSNKYHPTSRLKYPYESNGSTIRLKDLSKVGADIVGCRIKDPTLTSILGQASARFLTFDEALKDKAFAKGNPIQLISNSGFDYDNDIFGITSIGSEANRSFGPAEEPGAKLPSILTESFEDFVRRNEKIEYYGRKFGFLFSNANKFQNDFPLEVWRFFYMDTAKLTNKDYEVSYRFAKEKMKEASALTRVAVFERKIYDRTQKPKGE